jgi:hypothetical protein
MTAVTQFTLAGTQFPGVGNFGDISVGFESLEKCDSLLGLVELLDGGRNNERDLFNLLDTVTTGEDERGEGRCSEGGDGGKTALVLVHLDVPFAPSFGGGKHTTSTAHVTEGGLSGAVGTSTTYTGNTGDGTTSTPGLSTSLVTSFFADGVSLPFVLGQALVDLGNDIEPDGGSQNRGKRKRSR